MLVNGQVQDMVQIGDRGLAYGDGLFETVRLHQAIPVLLTEHLDRMEKGASTLKIPFDRQLMEKEIAVLATEFPREGVLKVMLTRGSGGRGYRPGEQCEPSRIIALHALPEYANQASGIRTFICKQRLADQPAIAGLKHLNRLEQVLASMEWPDSTFDEGLMLDMHDNIKEGTRSNLFWVESGQLMTPTLEDCGVAGILRDYLLNSMPGSSEEPESPLERLAQADEVFVCNSVFGIWPVNCISHSAGQANFRPAGGKGTMTGDARQLFDKVLAASEI